MGDHIQFSVGDKVSVKTEAIDCYNSEFRRKAGGGRVGVVRGYPIGRFGKCRDPIVEFPAFGRKKYYNPGQICWKDLELVESAEIGKSMAGEE